MSKPVTVASIVAAALAALLVYVLNASTPVRCTGVTIEAGESIQNAIDDHPERTTFCLAAGTYEVESDIEPKDGDRLIGTGMSATFLRGAGAEIIIDADGAADVVVSHMDISGSQGTPECKPSCGSGFRGGDDNVVDSVRFRDHPNHGIGGSDGGLVVRNSILDHNGSEPFTGCCAGGIKGGTGFTIEDSEVFSNVGVGIWCDVGCPGGMEVYGNHIFDNTRDGIRYEISDGGAIIEGNTVENNNTANITGGHGGITAVGSANATISNNVLRGNGVAGIVVVAGTRGVEVRDVEIFANDLNGNDLSGCGLSGVSCRD
ncbi:MAG: right-handed parallel beta-helix repeat-containing protein [Actinomycetota bacterium]